MASSSGYKIDRGNNGTEDTDVDVELPLDVQIAVTEDKSNLGDRALTAQSCLNLKVVYNKAFQGLFDSSTEERIKAIFQGADALFGLEGLGTRISLNVSESEY